MPRELSAEQRDPGVPTLDGMDDPSHPTLRRVLHDSAQIRSVERMEELVGSERWSDAANHFTDDVLYQVSDADPVFGVDGIRTYMDWQRTKVEWRGHDVKSKITVDDLVVIEVDSFFHRLADGADIIVPCTDVYRMDGERIADWRVYANTSLFLASNDNAS